MTLDPRIHFALNCGAKSCPPIAAYSFDEQTLNSQLQLATENFLCANVKIDIVNNDVTVKLSKIFDWYRNDFGSSDREILNWIIAHCDTQLKAQLETHILLCVNLPRIIYEVYSWELNSL